MKGEDYGKYEMGELPDWRIAIPSYKRADICVEKTLTTLGKLNVPPQMIDVFVASNEEKGEYKQSMDYKWRIDPIVAKPGMRAVRNFIQDYYEEGQKVLNIDDDICGFYRKLGDKYEPLEGFDDFKEMVDTGFQACASTGSSLWGIYPVLNGMFMKHKIRQGLSYIVGACWGVINTHDRLTYVTLDDKEDFERSLKFYMRDQSLVRLEWFSMKTGYYTTPGGMQEERTEERVDKSARTLVARYPHLCDLNLSKKSGHTELRLKDKRVQRTVLS